MEKRLNLVLLIDDDEDDNFFHKRVILKGDFAKEVMCRESAHAALKILPELKAPEAEAIHFIFLDINMPKMNGWEFIEAFSQLEFLGKDQYKIFILTTSLYPVDISKADENPLVERFIAKPLDVTTLQELTKEFL